MKKFLLAISVLCLIPIGLAQTNYYVSISGNNSNDGSVGAPFRNIQTAANLALPGDSIIVADGEYVRPWNHANCSAGEWCQAAVILMDVHGEPGNPIVFKSQNKHGAKISFFGRGGFIGQHCSYIVIDGFEIEGPGADITQQEAIDNRLNKTTYRRGWGIQFFNLADGTDSYNHHIEIRNNHVHHCPNAGIRIQDGDYILIEDNEVHDCSWWSSDANGGLILAAKKQIDTKQIIKIIVRRNKVYHIGNYNIFWIEGDNSSNYGGLNYTAIDDGSGISFTGYIGSDRDMDGYDLIENNICFDNGMNGLTFQQTRNGIIRNNTTYANNAYPGNRIYGGIAVNTGDNIKVYNNIAMGSAAAPNLILYNIIGSPTNFQAENNIRYRGSAASLYGSNVIELNPTIVNESIDPLVADFGLTDGSPAIDLGTTFDPTVDDFYGHARPVGSGIDAGAVEFSADSNYLDGNNNDNFWDDDVLGASDHHGEFTVSMGSPEIYYTTDGDIEILRYEESEWGLYNLGGKLVLQGTEENKIRLSETPRGLYLLKIGRRPYKVVNL
jgi:hypothetical protein